MRVRLLGGLSTVALFSLAFPPRAPAQIGQGPLHLSLTNKLDYRRLDQGAVREEAFRNRTELTAMQGILSAWFRLESLQVSDATVYDPYLVLDEADATGRIDRTEITKMTLAVETERLRAEYGDFSHVFGRGMLPSVFEDEELNFDTRLEGLAAHYAHDLGSVSAIGGSNRGNRFRGVYAEPARWRALRAGGGFVEAWGGTQDTQIRAREQHAGGYADVTVGPASLYGEYTHREFSESGTSGRGAFGAAILSAGGATLSAEYKDFEEFEHDYHDPPTALRQHTWTLLNRESGTVLAVILDDDVRGGLVEGEYSRDLFTTFAASYSELNRRNVDDRYWEAFGEGKATWQERVFVTLAAAESEFDSDTELTFEERIYGFGEVVGELDDTNSLTAGVEWATVQRLDKTTAETEFPEDFDEKILSLSYGRSPWLSLTVTHERTGDPEELRDAWTSLVAEVTAGQDHNFLISYGSERGGWKCTGGVCFFEPEFEGFKLQWVARF
jgi:hypothetical protein